MKLDQQELELRHKLGEFDDKEFQKRIKAIEAAVKEKAEARARGLEMKARFLEAFHAESDLEAASAATTPVTGRFTVPADETGEARTTDMPGVRPDLTPNKTQIMSAVNVTSVRPATPPAPPPPHPRCPPAAARRRFSARRGWSLRIPKRASSPTR